MELERAIEQGRQTLQEALDEWQPNAIFAGFSGGTDSLMATYLLHEIRDDVAALHINTGIGMKRTRKYVRSTCERMGWDLEEYRATDYGYDYDDMVRGKTTGVPGGFPGPPIHHIYYGKLKEVPIQRAHRDFKGKRGGKIALVTGIRKDESQIRTGYDATVVDELNGVVWINLIYRVPARKKQTYIDLHGLETNPVSDVYGMSGECLCGAFDTGGGRLCELKHACQHFGEPETYERIVSLQEEVQDRYPWRYDERRPKWYDRAKNGQLALEGMPGAEEANRVARMCTGCGKTAPAEAVT
jgi:3'-phosphoadenosine 5'-phosphosulfate sulfotransferase (PAPS reductase)/FAD synthetase